ncbi:MAG: hypothetical protein AB7P12_09730 [Alphaproteobacteria bacterium]
MRMPAPFRNYGADDMTPEGGFKDSWAWTLPICVLGFVWCIGIASWLALFGPATDHTDKRIIEFTSLAGIIVGVLMAGARYDAYSRRQATVTYETARMQITAQKRADLDQAAG